MGFSSFETGDTFESIANEYSSRFDGRPIYFIRPHGQPAIGGIYNGYGAIRPSGTQPESGSEAWLAEVRYGEGLIELFELLAEENREVWEHDEEIADWSLLDIGHHIYWEHDELPYPMKLSYNPDADYDSLSESIQCEAQGYFYSDFEV